MADKPEGDKEGKDGKDKDKDGKDKKEAGKCSHGPSGKCFNCMGAEASKDEGKWLCQHGPNGKCPHCMDKEFVSDVAHVSFDNYLYEKKLKCKGVHADDVKCNNCLPPSEIRYKVDLTCKKHAPYPAGMCNNCLPPTVMINRQKYRHVDYLQFMNLTELQKFVKHWTAGGCERQRFGWVFGYYASDPAYKGGIRAIAEAIYEPPQKSGFADFELLMDPQATEVELVAGALGLEKIGWIVTEANHDTVLSEAQTRFAARMQEEFAVKHATGYPVSKFLTVVMRQDAKTGEVKPEAYMISDQGQVLEREGLFVPSSRRKFMRIRDSQGRTDLIPNFMANNKETKEFEPEFLLVNVAHGSSGNKFAIIKHSEFPVENRGPSATKMDLKEYFKNMKRYTSHLKYADFHLLLHLARVFDMDTAFRIAEAVYNERPVSDSIELLVTQYSNF
jgi:nuclear protein localization family protein 4